MELHRKFRELREKNGWTQGQVAEKIFVSEKTISSWECGHRRMDADAIESLSKLYRYELLPEDKQETSFASVSIMDIANDPLVSLSARDVLGRRKVTLRVDIPQRLKRVMREISETSSCSLDETIEKALDFYVDHLNEQQALPNVEDGKYHIESSYYEREISFDKSEAETLFRIYHQVAIDNGFTGEVDSVQDMVENVGQFDTVMYHVEEYGKEKPGYEYVEHLFND